METKANNNTRPISFEQTELWKLFERKAKERGHSIEKLKVFCTAAETLSKEVIKNFPYFTLHDNTHIAGVCKWMNLLLGDKAELISVEETALLLMAACCHDLGMLIGENEEKELIAQAKIEHDNWKEYFLRHPKDREKLESEKSRHEVVVNYVRENHHIRLETVMKKTGLELDDSFLLDWGISDEMLFAVCKSHGEKLDDLKLNTENIDVNLCAVLLRLADALDYDSNRAPSILLRFLKLDEKAGPENANADERERSRREWQKNRAGVFHRSRPNSMAITYRAKCYQPYIEAELNDYLKWLKDELQKCYSFVETYCKDYSEKKNNPIPLILNSKIESVGYDSAEIRLMMDQNRVLELLSGEELYGDPGVFVRELLQNSIDAVLLRCESDDCFSLEQGEINIDVWTDVKDGRYCWFRIKDNGIGMDKAIVQKYFLNVGRSYYNDEEGYIKDLLKQGKTSPNFKPISRFGIGILSCFMGEGKTNRLEVSTKRFPFDNSENYKPVRLDITGLNGYYYLTELSEVKQGEPMPKPPKEPAEYEYMRGIGTTICLRLDLYNTTISSFRKLLDKFIRFPKIKISFTDHRTAETKTYPTQQELEALLDKLNPDFDKTGEVTKHVHRMKEEDFEKLKAEIPEADWSNVECPELVLEYPPLHKMSLSGNLSGAIVDRHVLSPQLIEFKSYSINYYGYESCLSMTLDIDCEDMLYPLSARFHYDYNAIDNRIENLIDTINKKFINLCICFSDYLTADEDALHYLLSDYSKEAFCTAYNGILCDVSKNYYFRRKSPLLLTNNYRPEVSLARGEMRNLPIDAACEIALLFENSTLTPNSLKSCPASEYYAFLEKYKLLSSEAKSPAACYLHKRISQYKNEIEENGYIFLHICCSDQLSQIMTAALKKRGYIFVATEIDIHMERSDGSSAFDSEEAFPLALFADRFEARGFGKTSIFGPKSNSFSPSHPFSKWLIDNRELLQKDARSVYDRIIGAMAESSNPDELTRTLNAILDQLRRLSNNPFRVPDDLRIEEGEITSYE
ncbi:MAG: ATP-binding protein [Clostridia bacterium]|nr:ATP-binding protein [Clostridia bacterium]